MIYFIQKKYYMEIIERKESRDKNNVCRYGLQIKSCRQCLFDALCSLQDNQHKNDSNKNRGDEWKKD